MHIIDKIRRKAQMRPMRIVLPEGTEERILRAADQILEEKIAHLILLGDPEVILRKAKKWHLHHIHEATIIDPLNNPQREEYIEQLVKLRAHKGMTQQKAEQLVLNPLYLGPLMILRGDADGEVAGACHVPCHVLRPGLQLIKTRPGVSVVSGAMIMTGPEELGEDGVMLFADCIVNSNPNALQLAEIAVESEETARMILGFHKPRIAMLSYSTKGSAEHANITKVKDATEIARRLNPNMLVDGELQGDAAIVPGVGSRKSPNSKVAGRANVLVFPNLDAGNIAYKLVQHFCGGEAIGPVIQGLAAPLNDLSRGCSVSDIINLVAITVCQAQDLKR